MEIRCRETDNTAILDVSGTLDLYHAGSLKETVERMIQQGARKLIINLSEVEYLDSSGIGALIMCYQILHKNAGALRLVSTSEPVNKVLALTRVDKFFSLFESEIEALASF